MMNLFYQYGWKIKEYGKGQILGSPADLFLEYKTSYKDENNNKFYSYDYMMIDDGTCTGHLKSFVCHIYSGDIDDGKIFEGRISNEFEFEVVMRVLGFNKKKLSGNICLNCKDWKHWWECTLKKQDKNPHRIVCKKFLRVSCDDLNRI